MFADVRQVCIDFDLPTARVRAEFAVAALEHDDVERLATEIGELLRHMRHDLQSCSIWRIARTRAWAFKTTLDENVATTFPSATGEFIAGVRATGFGLHTACAFHMLRAASIARDALMATIRMAPSNMSSPDWPSAIDAMQTHLATLEGPVQRGRMGALLNDARFLHNVERMLASGSTCDENYALAVLQTAEAFLQRAATFLNDREANV
jgi:hypothetical protein